ncbi:MAG: GDSL-type esterase/lipase family protein [Candidatus Omnitrophota bacterium]
MKQFLTFVILLFLVVWLGCAPSILNQNSKGKNIICFGDSLTEGVGAEPQDSYPSVLERLLDQKVINAGRRGDTTRDALKRLKQDVLNRDPRLVIVEFGANDFFQRIPKRETFTNLEKIITDIHHQGAMVALVTVKIGLLSDEYLYDFRKIAKKHKALLIPQVMKRILDNPQLKNDGIHPNKEGYQLIAERVVEKIKPLLD